SLVREKSGFPEYTDPSDPPKFYLKETLSSWISRADTLPLGVQHDENGSYTFTTTIDPSTHSETCEAHYVYADHFFDGLSTTDKTGNATYSWYGQRRGRGNVTRTVLAQMHDDGSTVYTSSQGAVTAKPYNQDGTYQFFETVAGGRWLGEDFEALGKPARKG